MSYLGIFLFWDLSAIEGKMSCTACTSRRLSPPLHCQDATQRKPLRSRRQQCDSLHKADLLASGRIERNSLPKRRRSSHRGNFDNSLSWNISHVLRASVTLAPYKYQAQFASTLHLRRTQPGLMAGRAPGDYEKSNNMGSIIKYKSLLYKII